MTAASEGPGFLGRWSRRKLGVAAEAEPVAVPAAPVVGDQPPADAAPEAGLPSAGCPIPDLPAINLASLPKLEELTVSSDLAPFLRPGVPAGLRAAALRRMWSLDPAIRDFIGCVEYQWDFNTPGGLPNGFSNELLGDVSKLLAQAIGSLPDAPAKPETPDEDMAAPAEAVDEPGTETPLDSLPDPSLGDAIAMADASLVDGPPPGLREPAHLAEPEPEPPSLPRRRHGGALPA